MRRFLLPALAFGCALAAAHAPTARAAEDSATGAPPFKTGDVVTFDKLESLKPYLPKEVWANRDFFFFEGMTMEIGPFQADYAPAPVYAEATQKFAGQPKLGPDGSLENYTAGQPFPMDQIDCKGDPDAGTKIIWNFHYRWGPTSGMSSFYYSYWDRGEELPLYYEGTGGGVQLSRRPEPAMLAEGGDMFRGETRKNAGGAEVTAPFDARGIMLLTYRYKESDKPLAQARNDDTWVYVPTLRRVRRISTAQRTDAISGTDFTLDDLFSFNGIVPQYEWKCLGEQEILAPMNTKVKGYPYVKDQNFGPYGLSFANDRWDLRKAVVVRMDPRNQDHPYAHKDIYIDKETLQPLYSFAYDQKQELWKILYHNHRWSGDDSLTGAWYEPWEEVAEPRVSVVVCDTIINVQTGTGNRIEFWDASGKRVGNKAHIRRYIDVGRLTRGR
ncbi:MAG: hypothetical protein DCC71_17570 [Proteobacteria bacterium]|nr:MAG: hypothetical protein DCC71_17570 [Pseudomonadota bacterium]